MRLYDQDSHVGGGILVVSRMQRRSGARGGHRIHNKTGSREKVNREPAVKTRNQDFTCQGREEGRRKRQTVILLL